LPDALRRAVERTFETTLGSTVLTRERAQELADDVLRGAEKRASRAGRGVREAGQRPRDAAAGVGDRLREVVSDLKLPGTEDVRELRAEVEALRRRIDKLERELRGGGTSARRKSTAGSARASTTRRRKGGGTR
jgi:polyhydroxyalkanoate synthesis regulator phasin